MHMKIDHLNLPGLAAPVGFSHVTVAGPGRLVHVSGQVSKDATGRVIGVGDLAAQTEKTYATCMPRSKRREQASLMSSRS